MSPGRRVGRRSAADRRADRAAVEDPDLVMAAAARLLEGRARSVAEVRRRLTGSGFRPELVEGVIERLLDLGLLDDEAFARAWLASRDRAHPRGERALRSELLAKGIAQSTIAVLLAERAAGGGAGEHAGPDWDGDAGDGSRLGSSTGGAAAAGHAPAPSGDAVAANRLLAGRERTLLRLVDIRQRRQRAWALLARAGFDPETAASAIAGAERRWTEAGTGAERPDESGIR
jgi:SOS response regulatory protein OraA/RecX